MMLVLHKIVSTFTTFDKKITILGGSLLPWSTPPDPRLNVSEPVKY